MEQLKADVVVVGGGPSGFGAAISAAREGARVILVEEDAMLGGSAVDYGVQAFSPGIVCGVNQEIRDILAQKDYTLHTKSAFNSHWYATLATCGLRESNLTVLTHTTGIGCSWRRPRHRRRGAGTGRWRKVYSAQDPGSWSSTARSGDIAVAAGIPLRARRNPGSRAPRPTCGRRAAVHVDVQEPPHRSELDIRARFRL